MRQSRWSTVKSQESKQSEASRLTVKSRANQSLKKKNIRIKKEGGTDAKKERKSRMPLQSPRKDQLSPGKERRQPPSLVFGSGGRDTGSRQTEEAEQALPEWPGAPSRSCTATRFQLGDPRNGPTTVCGQGAAELLGVGEGGRISSHTVLQFKGRRLVQSSELLTTRLTVRALREEWRG
ncbi:hypothetical protein P4O66_001277 [Electrophorus voltai]|uniref:Uncharacterized protein n=1 Tax=Electrophorus voltai TaxID=2609070 RepID=A0AAD9DUL6_9TELE|nr:hypothetical protein P4O66_001277 [Electrophorus voltai]